MCDVCRGKGGARVIQRDRDGSTAPGSLELLMRSPPLVFLDSVSILLSFSPFSPLNCSLSSLCLGSVLCSLHLSFCASYPVTPSTSNLPPPRVPRHRFRPSSSSSSIPTTWPSTRSGGCVFIPTCRTEAVT